MPASLFAWIPISFNSFSAPSKAPLLLKALLIEARSLISRFSASSPFGLAPLLRSPFWAAAQKWSAKVEIGRAHV